MTSARACVRWRVCICVCIGVAWVDRRGGPRSLRRTSRASATSPTFGSWATVSTTTEPSAAGPSFSQSQRFAKRSGVAALHSPGVLNAPAQTVHTVLPERACFERGTKWQARWDYDIVACEANCTPAAHSHFFFSHLCVLSSALYIPCVAKCHCAPHAGPQRAPGRCRRHLRPGRCRRKGARGHARSLAAAPAVKRKWR